MNKLLFGLVLLIGLSSCEKSHKTDSDSKDTNKWIEKVMRSYYFWYDEIPTSKKLDYNLSPDAFFTTLLSDKDGINYQGSHRYFSRIEKKTTSVKSSESGYGFEYAIGNVNYQSQKVPAALVLYVYPNTPASEANLKRGDWIIGVNSSQPNLNDYSILESGGAATLYLGKYSDNKNALVGAGTKEIGTSRKIEINPFLVDSVYRIHDQYNVGYLAYQEFKNGEDPYNLSDIVYDNQMKELFSKFKSQGVNEFILDLRLNPGGTITAAQLLTSLLVPVQALGKTFCTLEYNDKHTSENKEYKLLSGVAAMNLDLKRIVILTSNSTASASEAVINCLVPYMTTDKVLIIGSQTVGKNVGSNTFGLNEDYDWLIHPIITQVFNANHQSDYSNGFAPDIQIPEPWFGEDFYDLGDTRDELLNAALSVYTMDVQHQTKASPLPMQIHYNSLDNRYPQGVIIPSQRADE